MPAYKDIFLSVLGRAPQILTETLYMLCVIRKIPIREIVIVTTLEGYERATKQLLDPKHGQFYRLQADYPKFFRNLNLSPNDFYLATDDSGPIRDIRNRQQSEIFLELVMRVLWEKTADPNLRLHCSIAGGRKTMSTYLALALQFLGRPQDMLYHVLIDPLELENHPNFYYPPPRPTQINLPDGQTVDASLACIDLVDIPFIRLRERVQIDKHQSSVGYRQLLEWVQSDINQALTLPALILDAEHHALIIGDNEIVLQPQRFCLYWYFADRSRHRAQKIAAEDYAAYFDYPESPYASRAMRDGLLERFRALDPSGQMEANFREKVLENGELPMPWVLQAISRINQRIRLGLSNAYWVPFYLISAVGKRGRKCYGIKLEGGKMVVPEVAA